MSVPSKLFFSRTFFGRRVAHLAFFVISVFCADGVAHAQSIANGGFETPVVAAGAYSYTPGAASWTFSGSSGVTSANSAFTSGGPEVPAGKQVGFLQNTGSIAQSVLIVPNMVLSFHATQRVNLNSQLQSLQVKVGPYVQNFRLGTGSGRTSSSTITPPRDFFESYAVNFNVPTSFYNTNQTIQISGTNTTGDATAFIDSVAVSTPSAPIAKLWDPSLVNATWRSDYPTSSATFTTGACVSLNPSEHIITAGASPSGDFATPRECYGGPGSGLFYPSYPVSNWTHSTGYVAGNSHWVTAINDESVVFNNCTANSGPPNQSRPVAATGTVGQIISINATTTASDPAIGNYNVLSLAYNFSTADAGCPGALYTAFGTSATHGNVQPIALLDAAGLYRPHLKFNETVFSIGSTTQAQDVGWLTLATQGWNDGITRWIQIVLMPSPNGVPYVSPPSPRDWWNWNVKQSYYYPGGLMTHWQVADINSLCGVSWPTLSYTNTYLGSGKSPSSISHYDVDLYATIQCMVSHGAWGSTVAGLPDPVIVTEVEWALENSEDPSSVAWLAVWAPTVQ